MIKYEHFVHKRKFGAFDKWSFHGCVILPKNHIYYGIVMTIPPNKEPFIGVPTYFDKTEYMGLLEMPSLFCANFSYNPIKMSDSKRYNACIEKLIKLEIFLREIKWKK